MAIQYTTGTINQPDAGSVGLAMIEKIRDDVVAHPAWELVEEFTAGAGLARWYVLKCLAAVSGLPDDFFVIFGRTLASGELRAFICEEYTPGTHIAQYFCPSGYSSDVAYDNLGRHPATYTLGAPVLPNSSGPNPMYSYWTPSGTSSKWWIAVDDDGFTVAFNGTANGFMHIGAYTPLTQMPIDMPLQIAASQSLQGYGFITRNPAVANINYKGAALTFAGGEGTSISGQSLGFCTDLRYNDKLQNNERPVAEAGMAIRPYNTGDTAICGGVLGKQKRMRWTVFGVPAGVAFGDAYVLQGRLWVPYLPTDMRFWDTGVASS